MRKSCISANKNKEKREIREFKNQTKSLFKSRKNQKISIGSSAGLVTSEMHQSFKGLR